MLAEDIVAWNPSTCSTRALDGLGSTLDGELQIKAPPTAIGGQQRVQVHHRFELEVAPAAGKARPAARCWPEPVHPLPEALPTPANEL